MTKARNSAEKVSAPAAKTRVSAPAPKPPAPATAAASLPTPDALPKQRNQVDPAALMSRRVAGAPAEVEPSDAGPKVDVHVPRGFTLTDDAHVKHEYAPGKQKMPKAHAEHFYAQANGVTIED